MKITELDIGRAIHTFMPKWIDPITNKEGPLEEWIYLIVEIKKNKILLRNPKNGIENWWSRNHFDKNWSFYEENTGRNLQA